MITGFTISHIEGKIESVDALAKQGFPRLNINLESVNADSTKVKINYVFVADYFDKNIADVNDPKAKSIGQLKLGGVVEVTDTKENISAMVKKWTEKKTLPSETGSEILNGINFRCGATGTLVAYALGLVPPLAISTIKLEENK